MNLPSLPLDILLAVFRDLDVIDIVRTGVVSPSIVRHFSSFLLKILPWGVSDLQGPLRGHTYPIRLDQSTRKLA